MGEDADRVLSQGMEWNREVHQGRPGKGRSHAKQEGQGGVQENVQERTTAHEEEWMDDRDYAGAQGARHYRILHGEPRSAGRGAVQAGQGALQLSGPKGATWRITLFEITHSSREQSSQHPTNLNAR